jgi:hypothetical protein
MTELCYSRSARPPVRPSALPALSAASALVTGYHSAAA